MKHKMRAWLEKTKDNPHATYSDENVSGLSRQYVLEFLGVEV